MGYLERNSETLKTPGFSGFDSRVSGFSRVVIFGFGSGSGSKKVGLFPRVSGFRVQRPITNLYCCSNFTEWYGIVVSHLFDSNQSPHNNFSIENGG